MATAWILYGIVWATNIVAIFGRLFAVVVVVVVAAAEQFLNILFCYCQLYIYNTHKKCTESNCVIRFTGVSHPLFSNSGGIFLNNIR